MLRETGRRDARGLEIDERDVLLTTRFVDAHVINMDTHIHDDDDIKTLMFRNDVLRAMIIIIIIIYSNAPTPSIMHK